MQSVDINKRLKRNFVAVLFHGEGRKKVYLDGCTLQSAKRQATAWALCYVKVSQLARRWYSWEHINMKQWVKCTLSKNDIHLSLSEY